MDRLLGGGGGGGKGYDAPPPPPLKLLGGGAGPPLPTLILSVSLISKNFFKILSPAIYLENSFGSEAKRKQ